MNEKNFDSLGLSIPVLKAVKEKGYKTASPIQGGAIPAVLEGRDIMAAAQTGTGKTAAFTLPLLDLLNKGKPAAPNKARALVLTPTRELAAQIGESVNSYGKYLKLKSAVVFGGVGINPQMMKLRRGVDILVATPGRLLDLYAQNAVRFDRLEVLVLDEADRMLDMGFIHDIRRILKKLPSQRQNLLFSATFSEEIKDLARGLVRNPYEISVTPPNSTVELVKQWIHPVDKNKKTAALISLITQGEWEQVLVFCRTKHGANRLSKSLNNKGIEAAAIHGDKSQGARTRALSDFKKRKIRILAATDIAARGLDISQLPHVVNFDLPQVPEDYVHRIGRTGRAGAEGEAISLVCADEFKQLSDIEFLTGQLLERVDLPGFDTLDKLPLSNLNRRPVRKSKPARKQENNRSRHDKSKNLAGSGKTGAQAKKGQNKGRGNQKSGHHKLKSYKSSSGGQKSAKDLIAEVAAG